jgi:hypothetical protein
LKGESTPYDSNFAIFGRRSSESEVNLRNLNEKNEDLGHILHTYCGSCILAGSSVFPHSELPKRSKVADASRASVQQKSRET